MKKWEQRIVVLNNIYIFLLTNKKEIANQDNLDNWIMEILNYAFENSHLVVEKIKPYLNQDWTWERILPINQAILIMAYSESVVFKTDKPIIIEEAIKTAKNYSDEKAYRFVNSILDKIL